MIPALLSWSLTVDTSICFCRPEEKNKDNACPGLALVDSWLQPKVQARARQEKVVLYFYLYRGYIPTMYYIYAWTYKTESNDLERNVCQITVSRAAACTS
jgi:hypothetical protein